MERSHPTPTPTPTPLPTQVLLHGHRMWIANAGDCRVVLGVRRGGQGGQGGALEAVRLS